MKSRNNCCNDVIYGKSKITSTASKYVIRQNSERIFKNLNDWEAKIRRTGAFDCKNKGLT